MDTNIAGVDWSGTCRLREQAFLVGNSARTGGCGFKKTVPHRALLQTALMIDMIMFYSLLRVDKVRYVLFEPYQCNSTNSKIIF